MAVATRRPLLRRCSFILLVVLGIETAGAASNGVAGRQSDPSAPVPILASQNPSEDGDVERIEGEEAMKIFEEQVVAKYPDAWKASLKTQGRARLEGDEERHRHPDTSSDCADARAVAVVQHRRWSAD